MDLCTVDGCGRKRTYRRSGLDMGMHECEHCHSQYSSALAAALCCDEAAHGDED